jgi:hypothetical protein
MDISILKFVIQLQKHYVIQKLIFEFWIVVLESKFYILIQKIIYWVWRVFSTSFILNKSI